MVRRCLASLLVCLVAANVVSQEFLVPVAPVSTPACFSPAKGLDDALDLPFFDDFSNITGHPNLLLWQEGGALVADGFAPMPPTIGTLILDAYDSEGNLYPQASPALFPADTATSRPIRLDLLSPSDSVVFSFFYLPGGGSGNLWERVGDTPEQRDSLILEFYAAGEWQMMWSTGGIQVDSLIARTGSAWQYVSIPLLDSIFFDSTFAFRFRNYCSLEVDKTGRTVGGDQWNIDYVFLDRSRDTNNLGTFRDVAFVEPAPSMLSPYTAMPARQYRTSDMAHNISMTIANLYSSPLATHYSYDVIAPTGDTIYSYDGGYENAPAQGHQTAPLHANPTVGFTYPESPQHRVYRIVHTVREGTSGDTHPSNDTTSSLQYLSDFFAYDDGTAENGYGLTSTASHLFLAYRFDLATSDTLTAVDIYFNNTYLNENSSVPFFITIWNCSDDGRPNEVLYRDALRRFPTQNRFGHYVLERAVLVGSGSIFVGFEQVGNTYINIGFDRSSNTSDRIFYLTSNLWQQSILSGSLMLRPRFGAAAAVSVDDVNLPQQPQVHLYPNPTTGLFTVSGLAIGDHVELFDMLGHCVASTSAVAESVSIDALLHPGVYLVKVTRLGGIVVYSKLIVDK